MEPNYTGSVMAISALIVAGLTKFFGADIQVENVAQIIFGIIALAGIIKQLIDHSTQNKILASVLAERNTKEN